MSIPESVDELARLVVREPAVVFHVRPFAVGRAAALAVDEHDAVAVLLQVVPSRVHTPDSSGWSADQDLCAQRRRKSSRVSCT